MTKHTNSRTLAALALSVAVAALTLDSCAPGKLTLAKQTLNEAKVLFTAGQYAEAYAKYASATAQAAEWDSATYRMATISASAVSKDSAAVAWGAHFSSFGDVAKLKALNSSLERLGDSEARTNLILSDTTSFFTILGQQAVLGTMARRLAENQDNSLVALYGRLQDSEVKGDVFGTYFKMAKSTVGDKQLEKDCKDILKTSADQKDALYYLGKKRYDAAEASYTKLMTDYNKKKTQAAYAYLTRDLKKVVTPLYKESKTYFDRLRKSDPDNQTYIKYLININDRLSNEAEVKKLKKLLN